MIDSSIYKSKLTPHSSIHPSFLRRNTNQNSHGAVDSTRGIKNQEKYLWIGSHHLAQHPEEQTEKEPDL